MITINLKVSASDHIPSRSRYNTGCRCDGCRAEHASYARLRRSKRKDEWFHWKYGTSLEEYQRMIVQQNGRCEICGFLFGDSFAEVARIDHDHRSGATRGLLCNNCNLLLGNASDSVDLLLRMIEYLRVVL